MFGLETLNVIVEGQGVIHIKSKHLLSGNLFTFIRRRKSHKRPQQKLLGGNEPCMTKI